MRQPSRAFRVRLTPGPGVAMPPTLDSFGASSGALRRSGALGAAFALRVGYRAGMLIRRMGNCILQKSPGATVRRSPLMMPTATLSMLSRMSRVFDGARYWLGRILDRLCQ